MAAALSRSTPLCSAFAGTLSGAVYGEYFTTKPARSCVGGLSLPKGALVEVEVIAEV